MKRILFAGLMLTAMTLTAQKVDRSNFRAGINAGWILGDFSEAYSLSLGIDVYQHWGVSKEIDLGVATGFSNAFGEKQEIDTNLGTIETEFANIQFIPVAGSVRIYPSQGFKFGADLGYAIGINEGNEGGFYYRPSVGFDVNGGNTEINISYYGVSNEGVFSAVALGFYILF